MDGFLGHHVYRRSVSESVMSQEHCGETTTVTGIPNSCE